MDNEEWIEVKKTKKSKINKNITNSDMDKVKAVEVKSLDKLKDGDIDSIFSDNFDSNIDLYLENVLTSSKKNSLLFKNIYSADLMDFFYDYFDKPSSIKIIEKDKENNIEYYSDEEFF